MDTSSWRDLPAWAFLCHVIEIFAENTRGQRDWRAGWGDVSRRLRTLNVDLDSFAVWAELCARADLLRGTTQPMPTVEPHEAEKELSTKRQGKRGPKKLTTEKIHEYRQIKERWDRAREAGVSKDEFCRDEPIEKTRLESILRILRSR
jgi:hypothetical protein